MVENMLDHLVTLKHPEGKPLFEHKSAVLAYLRENPRALDILEADRPRWELGVGVGVICGLIIHHREEISGALGSEETIAAALQRKGQPLSKTP